MTSASSPVRLREMLQLAWPIVVARSTQAVIGFCDALMAAPLGEGPLAAVTTGAMNSYSLAILPMGVVFIAQSFAAQLLGRDKLEVALRYAWYALIVAGVTGIVALGAMGAIGPTLRLLGYEAEVLALMTSYLQIRMLGVGAAVGVEALGNWYGGLGRTRLHMVAGVVTMVCNIALNWVLIYGELGAPALGSDGAALASVLATWAGFAVVAVAFGRRLALPVASVRPVGLRLGELGRMLRFGLPHGLNWFLEFAAFAFFINVVVARLGTTTLAAMMVVFSVNSVAFMPAFGLSSAGAILTGQAIGRGQLDRVGAITRRTLAVAVVWQVTVGLLYLLFPAPIIRMFATSSSGGAELLAVGSVLLGLSSAWQLFDAASMTFSEVLRSAGDTAWTLWARITLAWTLFTPGAYLTVIVLDGGHVAAILCVVAYLAVLAVALAWRFRTGAWKRIDLTGVEQDLVGDIAEATP